MPTCQLGTPGGPDSKPGARVSMDFVSSFHPLGAARAGRPLRMFAGCSLGHTTVREKPLLSPGVLSTEVPPPGSNRKGGELCEGESSGWLSDVFIILTSYECSCHRYPKANPGYAKNTQLGLHRGLTQLSCHWSTSPKKARVLSVLLTQWA